METSTDTGFIAHDTWVDELRKKGQDRLLSGSKVLECRGWHSSSSHHAQPSRSQQAIGVDRTRKQKLKDYVTKSAGVRYGARTAPARLGHRARDTRQAR